MTLRPTLIPVLLAAALVSGCASTGATDSRTTGDAADPGLEALFWARQEQARSRYTPADVHFMTGMIGHHAQALIMSRLAPENEASPPIRTLAARIINAQNDEIATMQRWLRDRGEPVPEIHIEGTRLMVHGGGDHTDHTAMPGMLTQQQLDELAGARGPEFDRLFLTYMIGHHRGAVVMADELFATDGAAQDEQAFRLATDIRVDQLTEIARMERMLARMTSDDAGR